MYRTIIAGGVAIALAAVSAPSQAQNGNPKGLTRAEVQAELARARAAGEIQPWNDEVILPTRNAPPSTVTRAQVRAELEAGRGTDALLDLIRAHEKAVSAALGPHQSRSYIDRVAQLLGSN